MSSTEPLAFVTVIEPGGALEAQVLLLAESLRVWGGRLAGAPILAVSPRWHLPIRRSTLARFDELGILHLDHARRHRYSWYNFLNKALAIVEAREATRAEHLVWIDGDALVLDEPSAFLGESADFSAIFTGGDLSTAGPSDRHDAYWAAACDLLGLDLDQLPWVEADGRRVRYCIQAGIFRVRRSSAVCDHYLANLEALIESRMIPPRRNLFYHETVALALAPFTSGSKWSELPLSHNFVPGAATEEGTIPGLESAHVLHYHDRLYPPGREAMISALRRVRPDRAEWLEERLPSYNATLRSPAPTRLLSRVLREIRRGKAQRFLEGCRTIETGPPACETVGR